MAIKRWEEFVLTARQVADYFLALVDEEAGDALTNLKLQKLVYYAQGLHLALKDSPLFSEPIEAWAHGPVVPQLYRSLKQHGAEPIPKPPAINLDEFDPETREILDEVYTVYGQFSASKLRKMTHEESPWKLTPQGHVISLELMRDFFVSQLV